MLLWRIIRNMCRRVDELETDDSVTESSNLGRFIKLLESSDWGGLMR